ncbi:hypothetical protein [Salibacterium sp. K-3]
MRNKKTKYEGVQGREIEGKRLAVDTINVRLRTLNTMCRFWAEEGLLEENPMRSIKYVKDDKKKEVEGLSPSEIHTLLGLLR